MSPKKKREIQALKRRVWQYYKKEGRHALPWRHSTDPYYIFVSEIMLQQTQVGRVVDYYSLFITRFTTVHSLANTPFSEVLTLWQGLGYNRRARFLSMAAKKIVRDYGGQIPSSYDDLLSLPGVGPYTARAVRIFAFNKEDITIETNIRAVILYHFFPRKKKVTDREVMPFLLALSCKKNPREWHWALMDYGAYLKRNTTNPSQKSATHRTQSPFLGSNRQIRGAIIRAIISGEKIKDLPFPKERVDAQISALLKEGFLRKRGSHLIINEG